MKKEKSTNITRRDFVGTSAKALAAFLIVPRYVLGGKRADGSLYVAPSDMISLGIIGTGKQGRGLAGSFLKTGETRILALSEVYNAKAQLTLDSIKAGYEKNTQWGKYTHIALYNDFRELLTRKDIDAVVIATPDHWHAAMAVRAAETGKDIFCEKPLSLTVREGRAMVNATRKHKRVFQTGSMQRSWSEFRQAVELIRNGYIGEVKTIKVNVGPPRFDTICLQRPFRKDWTGQNGLAPTLLQASVKSWRHLFQKMFTPTGENTKSLAVEWLPIGERICLILYNGHLVWTIADQLK
jgi:hypothetical protein